MSWFVWLLVIVSITMVVSYLEDVSAAILPYTTGLVNTFVALWPLWAVLAVLAVAFIWIAQLTR